METAQPPAMPTRRPREVTTAAVELIVVGALGILANGAFFILGVSGGLEDFLEDAGYELTGGVGLVVALTGLGLVLALLAIISGIGVLRLRPAWRIVGIVTAVLLGLSVVYNLVLGVGNVPVGIILLLVDVHIVVGLARSRAAFAPPSSTLT